MDDGDDLVIDEGDDDVVDVGHAATDELFSPVIVSTCSLNKKEGGSRRSSSEDERPRSQSDESSKARHFLLSYVWEICNPSSTEFYGYCGNVGEWQECNNNRLSLVVL